MDTQFTRDQVLAAMRRAAAALTREQGSLTALDQAVGDGDLGITAVKVAEALTAFADTAAGDDLGTLIAQAGMAVNRAAPSTMGTLIATALMRAGKEVRGRSALAAADLAAMLRVAETGMRERGKAQLGDKTALDALHPAAEAFAQAVAGGRDLAAAAAAMAAAARQGLEAVTPLRNKVGRASWLNERSMGEVDPGCALVVCVLEALRG